MTTPESTAQQNPEKIETMVKAMLANLEQTYKDQKSKEIQDLHNAFIEAISKQTNPHIANILTALELVKAEIVTQKLDQIHREQQAGK
jgi:hypothetical protein